MLTKTDRLKSHIGNLIEINSPIFAYEIWSWLPHEFEWAETSKTLVLVLDVLSNEEFLTKPFNVDFTSSKAAIYERNGVHLNDDINYTVDSEGWNAIVKIFFKNYFGWIILYDDEYKFIEFV